MDLPFLPMETGRFLLRPLRVDDVSLRYLSWLGDIEARKWIVAAAETSGLADLRRYVKDKIGRDDVLFLGIFDKQNEIHVGNIKYDPIVPGIESAVMGVLIGEPAYRGVGLFEEVFLPTARWLYEHQKIRKIYLGVDPGNAAAVRAYEKVGFVSASVTASEKQTLGNVSMVNRMDK